MHRRGRVKALPDVIFFYAVILENNKLENYQDTYVELKMEEEG